MGRRKLRNRSRDGLFEWGPDGEITPSEVTPNPQLRPCPACNAPAGQRCRTRTRRRTEMHGRYHSSRASTEDQ